MRPQPSGPAANAGRQVARQLPAAGASVQPNSDVGLTLLLSVPALGGLDCDAAKARAREHGLPDVSCQRRRAGASQPIGRVFDQTPPPLTLLAAPQRLVALIAEPVVVPDVVGRALPAALATLAQSDLKGSADANDGDREVRSQQPRAGAEVAPGSTVALTTARFGVVQGVTGLPLAEARSRLSNGGFVAVVDGAGASADAKDRKVREQSPVAGTRWLVGSQVQLTTYREVVVPDVTRSRLPEATMRLQHAGLAGKPDRGDAAAEREVRAQTPAAGLRAPEGSDVVLQTVRRVTVPNLVDLSYSDARDQARDAGLLLGTCKIDSGVVPVLLRGPATVVSHAPGRGDMVDEGSEVTCTAEASVMPFVLLVTAFGAGGGAWLWRLQRRPAKGPARAARPVALQWRVAPDTKPRLALRFADARAGAPSRPCRRRQPAASRGDSKSPGDRSPSSRCSACAEHKPCREYTMTSSVELKPNRPLYHLLELYSPGSSGVDEVRRLAALGVGNVDADGASLLGRKVSEWASADLAKEIEKAFTIEPFTLLAKAWGQVRKVRKAIEESRGSPPKPQSVKLIEHEIDAKLEPRLVLEVNGIDWFDLKLGLALKLSMEWANLELLGGKLTSVSLGNPTGTLSLHCQDQEVAAFKRDIKLDAVYRLEPPLALPGS